MLLSESCENILTRRANQRHYSIIAQLAKRPWPCPATGSSSAIALPHAVRSQRASIGNAATADDFALRLVM